MAATLALRTSVASANPPVHVVEPQDALFLSDLLTEACETPVWMAVEGTLRITLRTDPHGVLHETDTFTHWSLTLSAPEFGTSFSYKFGPGFIEYPDGVYVGAPAILTFLGIDTNVPGLHAIAGRTVMAGEVIDIRPDGLPVADPTVILFQAGNQVELAERRAAICAALTGQ